MDRRSDMQLVSLLSPRKTSDFPPRRLVYLVRITMDYVTAVRVKLALCYVMQSLRCLTN